MVVCLRIGAGRRRGPSWARLSCHHVSQICLINANLICALALTLALPNISPVLTLRLDCSMNMLSQWAACDSQPLTIITATVVIKWMNLLVAKPSVCSKKDFFLNIFNHIKYRQYFNVFYVCLDLFSIDTFEDHDKALD